MTRYLQNDVLEKSSVVANSSMNRERTLVGRSGYEFEIGFNPLTWLTAEVEGRGSASWLDLCCGSGRALGHAAAAVLEEHRPISITGVDLVGTFEASNVPGTLELIEASLSTWSPSEAYDLITCVHGLHYVGDKLDLSSKAAGWLTQRGRFVANLDLSNIVVSGYSKSRIARTLRDAGFGYDTRKNLLSVDGRREPQFPLRFLGADDHAGPNYTGQPAVNSHYEPL